jgi:hypothetical protein
MPEAETRDSTPRTDTSAPLSESTNRASDPFHSFDAVVEERTRWHLALGREGGLR